MWQTPRMNDSFKAALWTAIFTFIATASVALLGFLGAVTDFINGNDPDLTDNLSVFVKVVMSAFIAAVSGLVNWLVRTLQAKDVLPGSGPSYGS